MKNQTSLRVWVFAAAVVVGACGSVSSNKDTDASVSIDSAPAGDFSLAVDQATLSIGITGQATVAVDVTRGAGFTDTLSLSVSGAPTGVAATFDTASLPDGTNAATLTIVVDATAGAGASTLTVTAEGGTRTHTATVELTLTTATVTGTVRGTPPNITVRLVGKDAVQTDANGAFEFTDVKLPYDIYVLSQGGPSDASVPAVTYYKGLTRLDPVLSRELTYCSGVGCNLIFLSNRSSQITGTRSGSGTNAGPTYVTFTTTSGLETNTDGTWDFTAGWYAVSGGTTKAGRLQALQAARTSGVPTGWYFAESGDVTLTSGSPSVINLSLTTLATTAALTGTITPPTGHGNPVVTLSQQLAGRTLEVWTATTTNATSTIPVLMDQKASFYARSTGAGAVSEAVYPNLTASTDVSMTMAAPAGITGPVDGAMNVSLSTPFAFTTTANQVYQVKMSSTAAIYSIYTATGPITIPDVEEMGSLPTSTAFNWNITGFSPVPNIDGAAAQDFVRFVNKFETMGSPHMLTTSATRDFTTQ